MSIFAGFVLSAAVLFGSDRPQDRLRDIAVACGPERADVVDELFTMEREAGVPPEARGLLVAAACVESRYHSDPKGSNDNGKAAGMLQFWSWAKDDIRAHGATTKDPRLDWRASATFWLAHVKAQLVKVAKDCKHLGEGDRWRAAEVTAVRPPRCVRWNEAGRCTDRVARCGERSMHWSLRQQWAIMATEGIPTAVNP